jgi:uncharacterized protein YqgV (UPF0045/DUF77 family)
MIAAFSITPLGVGESVGELVAEVVGLVRASGLPNETNAMFTNVEGDWDEVMALINDHRPGCTGGLTRKVESVERHLGQPSRGERSPLSLDPPIGVGFGAGGST